MEGKTIIFKVQRCTYAAHDTAPLSFLTKGQPHNSLNIIIVNFFSLTIIMFFLPSVMVSIWEGNQCKKAQLTLMEISATIANKVVSLLYH